MPSKEWEETTVTISRGELADIIAREMARVTTAAKFVGDEPFEKIIRELLIEYSACVASEIFKGVEDEITW